MVNLLSFNNPQYQFGYFNLDTKSVPDGTILIGLTDENLTLKKEAFSNPYNDEYKLTILVSKVKNDGTVAWSYPLISSESIKDTMVGQLIDIDENSNVYVSFRWKDKLLLQNEEITLDSNNYENILLKLDNNGQYLSHKKLGTHNNNNFLLSVKDSNKIILSGNSDNTQILDEPINTRYNSNYLIFDLEKEFLNTQESTKNNPIVIYPNPTKDIIFIKTNTNFNDIKIYDTSAKLVLSQNMKNDRIDVKSLPKGTYYLELIGKESAVVKFIKE